MDIDLDKIQQEISEIEAKFKDSSFFSTKEYPSLAKKHMELMELMELMSKIKEIKKGIASSQKILDDSVNTELHLLASQEIDSLNQELENIEQKVRELTIPTDPNDNKNVICEIRAAAGGDESSIFAGELFKMYSKWAENNYLKEEVLSENENEVGGFKEIIFSIKGSGVYGKLKYEAGVHRVQRIPSTESQGRIHTSTVTVVILPEAEEEDIEIDPKDLKIDVYRSSGHGGQSVNTTDSAVRITHLPTGIVVSNQDEKSQIKNKAKALSILRSRLLAIQIAKNQQQMSSKRRSLIGTGDRSEKIRTYNFPQDRITDHRINYSRSNITQFLNGDIDGMINKLHEADINLIVNEKKHTPK